jgi:4-amino-4-deoxy-L-arabinose transferase-like glycosyltransferase
VDKTRFHKELLILLLFLALGLRILGLSWQPLWWDEGYSMYVSPMPIGAMIVETAEDIHPPLYYMLLHCWEGLVGITPTSIRLFSVFLGVVTVLLIFQMGKHIGGYRLAWVAGLIAAVNPFLVYYSQEVRMYALATFLGLLSTYLMFLWLDVRCGRKEMSSRLLLVTYLAVTAAALYTHYYTVLIPLAQTLFVLLYYRHRRLLLKWLTCQAVLAIAYLPWIMFTVTRLTSYVSGKVSIEQSNPLGPFEFLMRHLMAFSLGHLPDPWGGLYGFSLLFLALGILGIVKARNVVDRAVQVMLWPILIFVSVLGAYLINLVYPFNPLGFERLLLFAAPGYCLTIAVGCLYLWQKKRVLGWLALSIILAASGLSLWVFYSTSRYTADDYRPLLAQVKTGAQLGDAVLNLYPWQIGYFRSYFGADAPPLEAAFKQDWSSRWDDPTLLPNYIDNLMAQHARVWFPAHQTGGRILERELEAYLATNYYTITSEWGNLHTRLFLFSTADHLTWEESSVDFGDRVRLVGYGLNQKPIPAGNGAVTVELGWQLVSDLEEPYFVGVRLADATDYTWAQRSAEPVGGLRPFGQWSEDEIVHDRHGLVVPADAPPGRYHVKVGIYRRSDGRGLDVISIAGIPQGVEVDLGTVDVVQPREIPALDRLQIPYARSVDLINPDEEIVRFLGHSLLGTDYAPGDELPFVLFWQPVTTLTRDNLVNLQMVDENGQFAISEEAPAGLGYYPTSQWRTGYPVRDPHRIVVPPETPEGEYLIRIGLSPSGNRPGFLVKGTSQDFIDLHRIRISGGRPHDLTPPQVPHRLQANWGDSIQLLGYDQVPTTIVPGETIDLTLYWKALAPMQTAYTVFVHLLDEAGMIQGQVDSIPGKGTLSTTGWVPGEYLRDTYSFQVQEDSPVGTYRLEIGIYEATTGARLPVRLDGSHESTDHILLPTKISISPK